jgi:hypothetical protein
MLHHVALEVKKSTLSQEHLFWTAVGFDEVPVPEALGGGFTWFERDETQIHLIHTADPIVPSAGHVAVVTPDFEETILRLESADFIVRRGRELWGEERAKVISPGGHTVELMAAPPTSGSPAPASPAG